MLGHWYIPLLLEEGEEPPQVLAPLGAWGPVKTTTNNKPAAISPDTVEEPIPASVVSRIQDELISASLAAEVIERAKQQAKRRKNQQFAILLTL